MSTYNTTKFEQGLESLNLSLSAGQMDQFMLYYELLIEKNKVMNLTGITEFDEVIEKHFLDSLSLVKAVDLKGSESVLDVGTGAGFPGIPLKIVFPDLKVVLLDSLNKRISFLNEVIEALYLDNISAVHGRAEDFARDVKYRESFDFCVSRAVSNLSSLAEYCLPYVNHGGCFVSYKSGKIEEELETAKKAVFVLGGKLEKVEKFELGDAERSILVIRKERGTPKMFPRKAGLPTKEPIC
ncbi:MAG: 16S rRNA (guanine(527)-N(7))-methyltransferase RsmG [Lachnospiraceae bacterium]|nr:16S rRNA (guanine(527)-N(7))-methyltransferase RsmG [Lachnospiraceae bacterium]